MDTLMAIELRKSIRNYLPKPVETEIIAQLLRAGNSAPKVGFFISLSSKTPKYLRKSTTKP